jgi:hypothetical protein
MSFVAVQVTAMAVEACIDENGHTDAAIIVASAFPALAYEHKNLLRVNENHMRQGYMDQIDTSARSVLIENMRKKLDGFQTDLVIALTGHLWSK